MYSQRDSVGTDRENIVPGKLCILKLKGGFYGLRQFLITESPSKMTKLCSLFHLKSSFPSQDI